MTPLPAPCQQRIPALPSPAWMELRIVKNNLGNIPAPQTNAHNAHTANTSHPATFFSRS